MTSVNVPSSGSDNEANVEPDMTQTPGSFEATQDSVVLSVGQQLRAAREARGLTADDVAKAIKLSFRQVKALEADDWPNLPGKTIIRGFVRNYARLLNLNSDQLMTELDRLHMPQAPELDIPTGPTVNLQNDGKTDRRDFFTVFAGLFVLLLAVLSYFLVSQDLWQSALSALKSATQSSEVVVEKVGAPAASGTTASVAVPVSPTPLTPPAATVSSAGATASPPADPAPVSPVALVPANGLKFSFDQPSWLEVRDRSGEVIFSQLCQAGSQRDIEGQPPFSLVVGNSSHVTLLYNGKAVDFSKHRSKDDVARLTLE